MPIAISREKLEELIRLAERAARDPEGEAHDPGRFGATRRDGTETASTPLRPQPAEDWRHAFEQYVADLPDEAHDEIISLYRLGGGPSGEGADAASSPSSGDAADLDRVAFITSRPDLSARLRNALERM